MSLLDVASIFFHTYFISDVVTQKYDLLYKKVRLY